MEAGCNTRCGRNRIKRRLVSLAGFAVAQEQSTMSTQQPWSGIQIETSFFPLSFFLYACTPRIVIDGAVVLRPWGTHSFQLTPGMHRVQVYFFYLFLPQCGFAQTNVVVQ